MNTVPLIDTDDTDSGLTATFTAQRSAFLRDGSPTLAERRGDLQKLKGVILAHRDDFVRALDADFGHRAAQETLLYELGVVIASVNYLHRHLARWMPPERRRVAMTFLPGSVRVIYQPLGLRAAMPRSHVCLRPRSCSVRPTRWT
jgi:coniferyl-aldehyde dehydrogenase